MPDAHANFAYGTVLTAPSPASSGTSLVVGSGQGAAFPAVPFNATVWPVNAQPSKTNAEIVRVTAISTDTFTITRQQESTSARAILVGDQIAATITAKTLTDAEAVIVAYSETTTNVSFTGSEVSCGSVTFTADGVSSYVIDFYCPLLALFGGDSAKFILRENPSGANTDRGILVQQNVAQVAVMARRVLTPAAGSITWQVNVARISGTNTDQATAGNGGAGNYAPMSITVWRKS